MVKKKPTRPELIIEKKLGKGGEGGVVLGSVANGKMKAFKFLFIKDAAEQEKHLERIRSLSRIDPPSSQFVMPEKALRYHNGGRVLIGMQMEVLPAQFLPLSRLLSFDIDIPIRGLLMIAINIALAMTRLHALGYVFCDLSSANIYFHPKTFAVKIIDCANICFESDYCIGTPGYMAPEIANHQSANTQLSDRLSLAIIIFVILIRQNPFHGIKLDSIPFRKLEDDIHHLAKKPLYIFNQKDTSNWLPTGHHAHALVEVFSPLQREFHRDFVDGLADPTARRPPIEWLRRLCALHSRLIDCQCGAQNIYVSKKRCWNCNESLQLFGRLKIKAQHGVHRIAVARNSAIYPHHALIGDQYNFDYRIAECIAPKNGSRLFLKNLSSEAWHLHAVNKSVQPGQCVPLDRSFILRFSTCPVQVDFHRYRKETSCQ